MKRFFIFLGFSLLSGVLLFEIILRLNGFNFELPRYLTFAKETNSAIESGGYLKDDFLFWRNVPLRGDINSLGLRGPELRNTDALRILCLGNSCTFGAGISYTETYPYKLETLLKVHKKIGVEVINAGVPNYSSFQGLRFFKRDLIKLKPDIVIVEFGIIDQGYCYFYSDSEQKKTGKFYEFCRDSLNKLKTVQFIYKGIISRTKDIDIKNYPMLKARVSGREFYLNLKELAAISDEEGIRVIFLNPVLFDFERGFVGSIGKEYRFPEGYTVLDLVEVFNKYQNPQKFFLKEDFCHMNSKGNTLVAEEILKVLEKEELI